MTTFVEGLAGVLRQLATEVENLATGSNGNAAASTPAAGQTRSAAAPTQPRATAHGTQGYRAPARQADQPLEVELTLAVDTQGRTPLQMQQAFAEYARRRATSQSANVLVDYLVNEVGRDRVRGVSYRVPAYPGYGSTDR
jgi:hypothetical protein